MLCWNLRLIFIADAFLIGGNRRIGCAQHGGSKVSELYSPFHVLMAERRGTLRVYLGKLLQRIFSYFAGDHITANSGSGEIMFVFETWKAYGYTTTIIPEATTYSYPKQVFYGGTLYSIPRTLAMPSNFYMLFLRLTGGVCMYVCMYICVYVVRVGFLFLLF